MNCIQILNDGFSGSEVWLELELESAFPVDILFDDISISLSHSPLQTVQPATASESSAEKSRRKVNRPITHTFSGSGMTGAGPGIHRTPSRMIM